MRIDIAKFRALAQSSKEAARDLSVDKAFAAEIKAAEGERVITARASTASVDRDNDTIDPSGWDLGNFSKNGPILWAHDSHSLPIGKARRTWMEAGALMCEMQFPEKDASPFADSVYQLLKGGFLNAVSVGFMPLEWSFNETRGGYGIDFKKQELLELSVVPIPSNTDALVVARSAGLNVEPLAEWAEKALECVRGSGLWVPVSKERLEVARKALLGAPVMVQVPKDAPTAAPADVPPPAPTGAPSVAQDPIPAPAPVEAAPAQDDADKGIDIGAFIADLNAVAAKQPAPVEEIDFDIGEVGARISRAFESQLIGPLIGRVS